MDVLRVQLHGYNACIAFSMLVVLLKQLGGCQINYPLAFS